MIRSYREIIQTPTGLKLSEVIEVPDSEDPELCSKCQKHGYCTAKYYKHPTTNDLIPLPNIESIGSGTTMYDQTPITDREISNIVNVRTDIKEATTKFGKKLQQAHDLFHQDEFEQASYMYLDIIETRTDIAEAWRGICACYYFMGKYDEAVAASLNINTHLESTFVNRFVKGCEGKIVGVDEGVKENQTYMATHLILDFNVDVGILTDNINHQNVSL
jgi:hypothetical protein